MEELIKNAIKEVVREVISEVLANKELKEELFKSISSMPEQKKLTENEKKEIVRNKITIYLTKCGIPRNIKGFEFLRKGLELAIQDRSYQDYITKRLYVDIAKQYDTTPSRVERAIRHAIEVGWSRGDKEIIELFGYSVNYKKDKPTNSEFICLIADEMRNYLK